MKVETRDYRDMAVRGSNDSSPTRESQIGGHSGSRQHTREISDRAEIAESPLHSVSELRGWLSAFEQRNEVRYENHLVRQLSIHMGREKAEGAAADYLRVLSDRAEVSEEPIDPVNDLKGWLTDFERKNKERTERFKIKKPAAQHNEEAAPGARTNGKVFAAREAFEAPKNSSNGVSRPAVNRGKVENSAVSAAREKFEPKGKSSIAGAQGLDEVTSFGGRESAFTRNIEMASSHDSVYTKKISEQAEEIVTPYQPVSKLKGWLTDFGQKNKEHYDSRYSPSVRAMQQKRRKEAAESGKAVSDVDELEIPLKVKEFSEKCEEEEASADAQDLAVLEITKETDVREELSSAIKAEEDEELEERDEVGNAPLAQAVGHDATLDVEVILHDTTGVKNDLVENILDETLELDDDIPLTVEDLDHEDNEGDISFGQASAAVISCGDSGCVDEVVSGGVMRSEGNHAGVEENQKKEEEKGFTGNCDKAMSDESAIALVDQWHGRVADKYNAERQAQGGENTGNESKNPTSPVGAVSPLGTVSPGYEKDSNQFTKSFQTGNFPVDQLYEEMPKSKGLKGLLQKLGCAKSSMQVFTRSHKPSEYDVTGRVGGSSNKDFRDLDLPDAPILTMESSADEHDISLDPNKSPIISTLTEVGSEMNHGLSIFSARLDSPSKIVSSDLKGYDSMNETPQRQDNEFRDCAEKTPLRENTCTKTVRPPNSHGKVYREWGGDMSMMSNESEITEFADQGLFTKLVSYDVDGFSEDCYRTDHVKWLESAFHVEEP